MPMCTLNGNALVICLVHKCVWYYRELLGLAWMKPDKHLRAPHVIQASQRFNEVGVDLSSTTV